MLLLTLLSNIREGEFYSRAGEFYSRAGEFYSRAGQGVLGSYSFGQFLIHLLILRMPLL